ncbi:conserved hypothetical protein [Parafrankia sp. Ea1.12]|nr:conserved hypothetical protein [Parafrankia sp. Ea1.12]
MQVGAVYRGLGVVVSRRRGPGGGYRRAHGPTPCTRIAQGPARTRGRADQSRPTSG